MLRSLQSGASLLAALATVTACAAAAESTRLSPAPVAGHLPDPAFLAERQCRGAYTAQQLERYVPRARLAMSLPGTHSVSLDSQRRCIAVNVQGIGDGRLAELVLRGVAVPRRAILLGLVN